MLRKILLAALLCFFLYSFVYGQDVTIEEALSRHHQGANSRSEYIQVYAVIPSNYNGLGFQQKYFVVWYLVGMRQTYPSSNNVDVNAREVTVTQTGPYYSVGGFQAVSVLDGQVKGFNASLSTSVSSRESVRSIYTLSDVATYYHGHNAALLSVPNQIPYDYYGNTYYYTVTSKPLPRDVSGLTRDSDGGGMGDWDEVFRNPYPGSDATNWHDDQDCK